MGLCRCTARRINSQNLQRKDSTPDSSPRGCLSEHVRYQRSSLRTSKLHNIWPPGTLPGLQCVHGSTEQMSTFPPWQAQPTPKTVHQPARPAPMVPARAPNDTLYNWTWDETGYCPSASGQARAQTIFPRGNACVYGIRGCAKPRDTKLGLR